MAYPEKGATYAGSTKAEKLCRAEGGEVSARKPSPMEDPMAGIDDWTRDPMPGLPPGPGGMGPRLPRPKPKPGK